MVAPQFARGEQRVADILFPGVINNPGACSVSRKQGSARLAVMAPLTR